MKGGHEWWKYVYDEYYDCVLCPEYQVLNYHTTNRMDTGSTEATRRSVPTAPPAICAPVPKTVSKRCSATSGRITRTWRTTPRYTPEYRELYKRRKETIERVFADAKEKHAMRYTQYRGLAQVSNWVKLKFAAMNLKKLASRLWKEQSSPFMFVLFWPLYARNPAYA